MGVMNIINPFMGGMPLCHGSGGLAAQYSFGARTGGSMILEGVLELIFGLFFSQTLLNIFKSFPRAILGTMLFYTALLLGRVAFSKGKKSKIKEEKRKKPKNAETMQKKQIKEKEIKENESIDAPKKESAGKGKGKGIKNELKEMSPFFFGIILISGIVCVFTNISIGFLTSLVLHYGWKRWIEKKEE